MILCKVVMCADLRVHATTLGRIADAVCASKVHDAESSAMLSANPGVVGVTAAMACTCCALTPNCRLASTQSQLSRELPAVSPLIKSNTESEAYLLRYTVLSISIGTTKRR
jgi:hypothetical protein